MCCIIIRVSAEARSVVITGSADVTDMGNCGVNRGNVCGQCGIKLCVSVKIVHNH